MFQDFSQFRKRNDEFFNSSLKCKIIKLAKTKNDQEYIQ